MLGDRDLADRLGAAGRLRALEQFTEARAVDRVESLYARIIGTGVDDLTVAIGAAGPKRTDG